MRSFQERLRQMEQSGTGRSLVELYGTDRVLVECHRGIRQYGTREIRVGTSYGALVIQGEELRLCCMSREQIFISGKIRGITLEGGTR